jgi:hypothetical protein
MRFVRAFAFRLAIFSLLVVPFVGVGCNDQAATTPPPVKEPTVDLGKKADVKQAAKSAKKKSRSTDESGSTTGTLGVKPPKVKTDDAKK